MLFIGLTYSQREDVYMHFRWTPRTTRIAFIGVVLVPASVYVLASAFDVCA
jgi:hypothetical protein